MMTLDQEADRHVAEMVRLGAMFDIVQSGTGQAAWIHDCRSGSREAIGRYKAGIDLTRPGMQAAMTAAVLRLREMRGAA